MFVSCILLAAGKGVRLRAGIPKPLIRLNGCPVIIRCLRAFNQAPSVKEIIVVVNPQNQEAIKQGIRRFHIARIKRFVLGGLQRKDSVANGLKYVNREADLVLIHDAARPFVDKRQLFSVIREARRSKAAILAVPAKNTIKTVVSRWSLVDGHRYQVKKTLDRGELWEVQTPQVFEKKLIQEAYRRYGGTAATDDAMLVEKLGAKVSIVRGSCRNIKITTPEDLVIAEAIAKTL
jgi:2-C-methyl-D-erythritol 4-phosphate cytidylyltransferase